MQKPTLVTCDSYTLRATFWTAWRTWLVGGFKFLFHQCPKSTAQLVILTDMTDYVAYTVLAFFKHLTPVPKCTPTSRRTPERFNLRLRLLCAVVNFFHSVLPPRFCDHGAIVITTRRRFTLVRVTTMHALYMQSKLAKLFEQLKRNSKRFHERPPHIKEIDYCKQRPRKCAPF
jgi:hypothetical protein